MVPLGNVHQTICTLINCQISQIFESTFFQFSNAARAERHGYGKQLYWNELNSENLRYVAKASVIFINEFNTPWLPTDGSQFREKKGFVRGLTCTVANTRDGFLKLRLSFF